jgi:hypothetical protein
LCKKHAAMEMIAPGAQKKQAVEGNRKREKNTQYKQVLEKGDIGVVRAEKYSWRNRLSLVTCDGHWFDITW